MSSVAPTWVYVECRPCPMCGKASTLKVLRSEYLARMGGALVQDAFPNLNADQRELLISGTHAHCWEQMFAGSEE